MTIRLFRPCIFWGWLYPEALLRLKTTEKILCITFDDGPDPDSTPGLLDILDEYHVKAVFFCSGQAAEKHPSLVEKIKEKGHIAGNHGFSHADGWKTSTEDYYADIIHASRFLPGNFFRPPYGRITHAQYKKLKTKFKIVFWDLMAYDFDNDFGAAGSLSILKRKIRNGSVIVLHDRPGSSANSLLNEFLESSISRGYRFVLP
ncbi:MAG: polysaccharide deacetylase family protein [Bacteroidales bacterium]